MQKAIISILKSAHLNSIIITFLLIFAHNISPGQIVGKDIVGKIINIDSTETVTFRITIWSSHSTIDHNQQQFTTDSIGLFKFKSNNDEDLVIEVSGEKGSGRILLPAKNTTDTLFITYPVTETVVLLHTNDHHFDINLVEELAEEIAAYRNQYSDVYLLEAGDLFVRHPFRWKVNDTMMDDPQWYGERARQMIQIRNDMKYDMMTPGNHELAYIEDFTLNALREAEFPLLAANIEISTERLPQFDDYLILSTSTHRQVAFLGLTNDNARKKGVNQLDIFKTANNYMHLRDSADIFVALTHIGHKKDKKLAERFSQIDVIVGGHSHTLLDEAILINNVLVAQAGGCPHVVSDSHPVYLGVIVLKMENGIIKNKQGRVIHIQH